MGRNENNWFTSNCVPPIKLVFSVPSSLIMSRIPQTPLPPSHVGYQFFNTSRIRISVSHAHKIINNYWTRWSKISCFVSGKQINYLPKPKNEAKWTQPSLRYFTSPMNCLITWINIRYLLLFFWTCPKLLIAFDTIPCYVNFAKLVYLSLRVPGSKAIYRNVNKSSNFRILYLLPYPLRLGYRKDPSWAR